MKPLFDDNNHISRQTTWSFVCLSTNNHLWTTRLALPFSISLWTKKSGMMLSRSSLGFVGTFGNNSVRTPNRFRCNRCKPSSEFVGVTLNPKKVQLVQGAFYPTPYPFPRLEPVVAIRHGDRLKKLGKPADQRKALIRALTTELLRHGRIKTTLARAKVVRSFADKMISLSKEGTLHARRQALAFIYDKQLVHALFEQAPERYADRNGGYTRIFHTMPRKGDNAEMGVIELV